MPVGTGMTAGTILDIGQRGHWPDLSPGFTEYCSVLSHSCHRMEITRPVSNI